MKYNPLTLPSPARGEGKYKIKKEISSPLKGGGKGGGDAVRDFYATFG
jgi:hypothetical protein